MTFTALLSALGLAPKTLPQAQDTLETAKSTFDQIEALFSAAGLNLPQMLAAGPNALKAHIDSVSAEDGELAKAKTDLAESIKAFEAAQARAKAADEVLSAIGAKLDTKPEEYKALLGSHVKEQAALELAKHGHKPVAAAVAEQTAAPGADATREQHYEYMGKLPVEEQQGYFRKFLKVK